MEFFISVFYLKKIYKLSIIEINPKWSDGNKSNFLPFSSVIVSILLSPIKSILIGLILSPK